jgi:hypothetical protein
MHKLIKIASKVCGRLFLSLLVFGLMEEAGSSKERNSVLIHDLVKKDIIKTSQIEEVMLKVDRGEFLTKDLPPEFHYMDRPMSINFGATISGPHMHAYALVSKITILLFSFLHNNQ